MDLLARDCFPFGFNLGSLPEGVVGAGVTVVGVVGVGVVIIVVGLAILRLLGCKGSIRCMASTCPDKTLGRW